MLASENFLAEQLTGQQRPVRLHQQLVFIIKLLQNGELLRRPLPLTVNRQQLEQRNAREAAAGAALTSPVIASRAFWMSPSLTSFSIHRPRTKRLNHERYWQRHTALFC